MLFVIDFDGTLAVRDTVDTLLEKFAGPEWREVEQRWLDGEISAVECMQRQLRMVRSDRITLEAFFRGIQLDPDFLPFYRHVSPFAQVAIVSDGLDHAIHVALRQAALPEIPVYANKLHFVADGLDLSWPHRREGCAGGNGVCKCAVAEAMAGPDRTVVLIGDGKSDACLAQRADIVFAKGSLIRYCQQNAILHTPFDSFADVLATLQSWPQRAPRQGSR